MFLTIEVVIFDNDHVDLVDKIFCSCICYPYDLYLLLHGRKLLIVYRSFNLGLIFDDSATVFYSSVLKLLY